MEAAMARKTASVSVRVEPEILDELRRIAEADHRAVAQLVRNIVTSWVQAQAESVPVGFA
jgi:predicted DNA-binding ribbon-helix-helix protein